MNIAGKVFVVTGAGNGIGREVTLQLLRSGASVAGVDLNADGLAETVALAAAGNRLSTHTVNITDRDAVEALPAAVADIHGAVDGIVNVAGVIQKFVKIIDLPYEEIEKVMTVNFWGTLQTFSWVTGFQAINSAMLSPGPGCISHSDPRKKRPR